MGTLHREGKRTCTGACLANLLPVKDVEEVETGSAGPGKETVMGATFAAVQAVCPLCESPVWPLGRSGRVFVEDLHPIQLRPESVRGYTLCDDCGVLANLPTDLTRN